MSGKVPTRTLLLAQCRAKLEGTKRASGMQDAHTMTLTPVVMAVALAVIAAVETVLTVVVVILTLVVATMAPAMVSELWQDHPESVRPSIVRSSEGDRRS